MMINYYIILNFYIALNFYIVFLLKPNLKKFLNFKLNKSNYLFFKTIIVLFFSLVINYMILNFFKNLILISFYICINISSFYMRKLLTIIFYKLYNHLSFFYSRNFKLYSFYFFNLKIKKNFLIKFLLLIVLYFYSSIILIIIISIIYCQFDFRNFEYDFDEAFFFRHMYYKIILYKSGKKKLRLYKNFLLNLDKTKCFHFSKGFRNCIHLSWRKDFKFKKKQLNEIYYNGNL